MGNWLAEFRLYQRDKEGQVVKTDDHLMDATRYLIMSGRGSMRVKPEKTEELRYSYYPGQLSNAWMAN